MARLQEILTRRRFVQATAAGGLALAGFGRTTPAQSAKPNILFIMADDLGYADVSCYGQRDYTTPNVDRLAIEGLKFTHAYANSAVCSATRIALITGRYQYRLAAGLEEPLGERESAGIGLPPSHPTLPSLLKKIGYATSLVGKWHLGALPDFSPLKSGYDHFFGTWFGSADYFNHGPNSPRPLYEQDVPAERHGYITNLLGDRAVQMVESYARSKEPFLLSLHFTAPHWPWEGPDDEAESKRIAGHVFDTDGGTQKTYGTMVQSLDANIGRVLQTLEFTGLAANTIVVFTSDNGGERFSKTWPFSGMKTELLEGGLRIPAIVRWPGRIAAGSVSEQTIITMDWMPTLLAAAGTRMEPSHPPDGENLLPTLTGRSTPNPRKLYWRYKAGAQRAVRDGDLKYLRIAGNEFLFDVVNDPRERANLKNRRKDVFDRLKSDWEGWNATMLPERLRPASYENPGELMADHYGVTNPPRPDHGGAVAKP
ncbi:MAG TPA: sulfatase-like hydrolase/transferase [Stellaceae bacterium]|nr:sulfatase-like hydrolase/transferase [Stellaceae bacterium]